MAWLLGWDYNVAFMPYGDWWRRHIRALHQFFNSRAVLSYEPSKLKACRGLLQNLLKTPERFSEHIQFSMARVIMDLKLWFIPLILTSPQVIYAIDIKPENDFLVDMVHVAVEGAGNTILPGKLTRLFPVKYIPNWIPGIPFKKLVKKYKEPTDAISDIPFNTVLYAEQEKKNIDHSFVSRSLERLRTLKNPLPNEEAVIKNTAGIAYAAGAGTTFSGLIQAVVASVLYPEVQKRLHDELDTVLGDRLPTLADRKDLPYFNAFCYEVLRWRPGLPLAVPHAALEDDIYGGYFIPKGSIVVADAWYISQLSTPSPLLCKFTSVNRSILRDEKYGPNPEEFNPERFLQPGTRAPTEQFGFGRRICPGRFFALNIMFLFMASIFKVYEIVPAKDENGNDIPVTDRFIASGVTFFLLRTFYTIDIYPQSGDHNIVSTISSEIFETRRPKKNECDEAPTGKS
ncbi:hypothetical protein Clacol_007759 [Clathrus columnatus]|uniref:Cytochrome P450 n=1 Tax=Clathrus columnatus TaxID=1419009 RepID=A0AAV5AKV7_9AGAM|nr:hypothetical protein Clacol_007759 [Clathrus columnatus]